MKNLAIIVLLLIGHTSILFASANPPVEKIKKYNKNPQNSIRVPMDFAKEFILTPEVLNQLTGKKIHHIDLVYTAFRESEDFDQRGLNKRRQQQLMKALPQIKSDNPTWKMVEQLGAQTSEVARDYFHGFVIHIGEELSFEVMSDFFKPFQTPFTKYDGDNTKDKEFKYPSGTKLSIPANAVTYADGSLVKGGYTLKYKEFRNPADIVYSGIPMTYKSGDNELNFSSNGMYEVRATKDGKDLSLAKPIAVDFNCTEQAEGVDFYQMDDETGEWEQLQKIEFEVKPEWTALEKPVGAVWRDPQVVFIDGQKDDKPVWIVRNSEDNVAMELSEYAWKHVSPKMKQNDKWMSKVKYYNGDDLEVRVLKSDSAAFSNFLENAIVPKLIKAGNGGTLLAEGMDAGHTYPNLVKGLNSESFGVYNCDQIYRIGTPLALSPTYFNSQTGNTIQKQHVTCVMDLSYNGSFSFQPNNLTCNAAGENVILLFTSDKKTFMLTKEEFNEACKKNSNSPRFNMKDMTAELKTSDDLKTLLGL
ncbi:MAG: hypothetical protein ACJA1C_000742 [Crocinitomicaceae bacterium]|jgi:hypothetical protein